MQCYVCTATLPVATIYHVCPHDGSWGIPGTRPPASSVGGYGLTPPLNRDDCWPSVALTQPGRAQKDELSTINVATKAVSLLNQCGDLVYTEYVILMHSMLWQLHFPIFLVCCAYGAPLTPPYMLPPLCVCVCVCARVCVCVCAEVAELVAFLASDRSSYITGSLIDINGTKLIHYTRLSECFVDKSQSVGVQLCPVTAQVGVVSPKRGGLCLFVPVTVGHIAHSFSPTPQLPRPYVDHDRSLCCKWIVTAPGKALGAFCLETCGGHPFKAGLSGQCAPT